MKEACDLRRELKRCGCPLVTNETDDDEVFGDLLLTPSTHRTNLLNWMANKIIGDDTSDNNSDQKDKLLVVLRLSQDFVSGQVAQPTQLAQWRRLCELLKVRVDEEGDSMGPELQTWTDQFQQCLLTQGLALPATPKPLVDLIPRDIRIAKGPQSWTKDQLQQILDSLQQKVEALVTESGFHSSTESPQEGEQSELIGKLSDLTAEFLTVYKSDMSAWIDRVPVVGENRVLEDLAHKVLGVLSQIINCANCNQATRESVTSIKSRLLQLKSNDLEIES